MQILITGSSGLVGSACVELFKEKGWDVFGIDNNMRAQLFNTPKQKVDHNIDIRHEEEVLKIFAENKFDAIIHAAAQPSHDWAKNSPLTDFDCNARATLILLEATRFYCPDAVFVHVSTDKVYGENMQVGLLNERETRLTPDRLDGPTIWSKGFRESLGLDSAGKRSLFGCSKTAADIYVQEYGNYFGMKTACFRCGCITGKKHQGAEYHGFLAYLAQCIKEGRTYKIFGHKGKQVRDQIHASDLANAFYCLIQRRMKKTTRTWGAYIKDGKPETIEIPNVNEGGCEVYNMGGGPERSVSILEAIEHLESWLGKKAIISHYEAREGDRIWDVHDVSKFRSHYPEWDYKYSLDDIIKDLCS